MKPAKANVLTQLTGVMVTPLTAVLFAVPGLPLSRNYRLTASIPPWRSFRSVPECQAEYSDPVDRRFHGQTISCPKCGPELWFADPGGQRLDGDPIAKAKALLKSGAIIAIKGVGGYHLACDAHNEETVRELRQLKGRDNRPFAVMFRDAITLQTQCRATAFEIAALESPARPIILLPQAITSNLAGPVNPGLKEIGAFLPYTGIQLLLFDASLTALVMTSGNRSGEPLTIDETAALSDLAPMVAGFLMHNRPIQWRCDDSVLRLQQDKLVGIRRSRGYAPAPIKAGKSLAPILACGAQQKNTFALTKGDLIYLSQHQGDLDDLTAFLSYRETIARWERLLRCKPEWVVHDLHPDYNSTQYASGLGLPQLGIQHHVAHLGAVIATQRIKGPVIGVSFDGSGYGSDGKVWGGEFICGEGVSWQRYGQFKYYPLPGGEAAIHQPWRMAAAYLEASDPTGLKKWLQSKNLDQDWAVLATAAKLGLNAPLTSSAGRLFDAVASLVGGITAVSYEGEAAIWLEQQADHGVMESYPYAIQREADIYQIDPGAMVAQVLEDLNKHNGSKISMKFHRTIAALILEMAGIIKAETAINQVILSGGVFQNRLLLDLTWRFLEKRGFIVHVPEVVPVNDAGIALGQAWLGGMMVERGVNDVFGRSR